MVIEEAKVNKLPAIEQDEAGRIFNKRFLEEDVNSLKIKPYFIPELSTDPQWSALKIGALKNDLIALRDRYAKPGVDKFSGEARLIDSEVIPIIHSHLKLVAEPYTLNQISFWAYLSNLAGHEFWDFIRWRYGSTDDNHDRINWGIGSQQRINEVYFYRAWVRGHLLYDESLSDPYEYAKKGGSDNWRSHLLRREFAYDKEFIKAFLDYVDNEKVTADPMRKTLIPSINAWSSSASFVGLTYDESYELIDFLYKRGI